MPETPAAAEKPWTVAVLGPGGVGGLTAALLARAGHRVLCLAGPGTAEALRTDGIRVRSERFGDFRAEVDAAGELPGPVDLCLVAVKETALGAALDRVPADRLGHGLVVPLLNGLDHLAPLRARYPREQVAAAVIRIESTRVAPGRIEHTSPFAGVELAAGAVPRERVERVAALLKDAGLGAAVRDDEAAMLWDKLAFLAPMALLTTRYAAPIGTVRTERRAELTALLDEITAVARAEGAAVDPQRVLGFADEAPAGTKSSMQRDAEAGRPLELDAIGGSVLRAAERHGVPVPAVARIVAELRAR
ncbi:MULTISPECIES: ketopantoate reductase family protein [Streptomyces]|uniref:2-dehydropantoate 2-reductase n=1 Tax=Streptomyces lycii TaxID=2654337 RepID=A0ABQ7FLW7_9ACTN|nr:MULTISPECIES: 2-dehydropantoate 2-reductase [Streptomyces]KAF4409675.1 2-dehydropantoate 2-reductase [Streptomyces lycii]PGH47793.1 2-dehydropantoate 2-reductase [Streptomyces sp. Ru87]